MIKILNNKNHQMEIGSSKKIDFTSELSILLVLKPFSINEKFMTYVERLFILINQNLTKTNQKCNIIVENIISENEFFITKVKEYSNSYKNITVNALTRSKSLNYLYPILQINSKDEKAIINSSKPF
jgi:hypothetical protein